MSSQRAVIGLVVLTLCATIYVAVSMPGGTTAPAGSPVPEGERGDSETARAIEELRTEIKRLGERVDQCLAVIEHQAIASKLATASDSSSPESIENGGLSDRAGDSAATEELSMTLADRVAESVQTQLEAKLDRLEARQRNRNTEGEWKAPIAELADELELSEAQRSNATGIFNQARDDVFDLLKMPRQDGGSLLDDLATDLRNGKPDAFTGFIQRVFADKVPGSDRTYLAEMISLSEQVVGDLSSDLSTEQREKLSSLKLAVLEVDTGYDPVGEYIKAALLQ